MFGNSNFHEIKKFILNDMKIFGGTLCYYNVDAYDFLSCKMFFQ
jgi:hypothetical protein